MSYWLVWPIGIALWVGLGWAEFGVLETRALRTNDPNKPTLSRFTYTVFTKFPLSIMLAGLVIGYFFGTINTHILWHWCPPGSVSGG